MDAFTNPSLKPTILKGILIIVYLCFVSGVNRNKILEKKSPVIPKWPRDYKTCVQMENKEVGYLTVGWYVDADKQRMRLDSYGIPKTDGVSTKQKNEQYACKHLGAPLYEFIFDYKHGKRFDIFPKPDAPYKSCTRRNISHEYPPDPILPGTVFIGYEKDNVTTYSHWVAEYFLFTLDYYFHVDSGLPYKFFVDAAENHFLTFDSVKLPDSVFQPPPGILCALHV